MKQLLPLCLWSLTSLGVAAIALIADYAARNDSGHTAWEPFSSLILFLPLVLVGTVCFVARNRLAGVARASVCALAVGLAGVALIVILDRINRLVQYDRWIYRGMPRRRGVSENRAVQPGAPATAEERSGRWKSLAG